MKHVCVRWFLWTFSFLFSFAAAAPVHAEPPLPGHMEGGCLFTFKSSVPAAESLGAARIYVKKIKDMGFRCVILKSHDGDNWGTKVSGTWRAAVSKHLFKAAHEEGMRAYSYFTARLNHDAVIDRSIELAEDTLKMGADGVVIDDLDLFGKKPEKWERAFSKLRAAVNKYPGRMLASSTHPHHVNVHTPNLRLWAIAFKYSDYFLSQEYWMEFVSRRDGRRMIPQDALAYGQSQFDIIKTRFPEAKGCQLIPVGRTYSSKGQRATTSSDVNTFLRTAMRFYKGAQLFVIEQEPKGGWGAIKPTLIALQTNRTLEPISSYDQAHSKAPAKTAKKTPPHTSTKQKKATPSSKGKRPPSPAPTAKREEWHFNP